MAIKASLTDYNDKEPPTNKGATSVVLERRETELGVWTWKPEEKDGLEKLVLGEEPTTTEEIGATIEAMTKPLKMWPGLYRAPRTDTKTIGASRNIRVGGGTEESLEAGKKIHRQRTSTRLRQQTRRRQ